MDHKGLIDFNKYTLAIAAGSVIYTLSNFVPVKEEHEVTFILWVLGLFLASIVLGILVFAAATSSLHGDEARKNKLKTPISWLGGLHAATLVVGLVLLGVKLYDTITNPITAQDNKRCECNIDNITIECSSLPSAAGTQQSCAPN